MVAAVSPRAGLSPTRLGILTGSFMFIAMIVGALVFYYRTFATYESQIHDSLLKLSQTIAAVIDGDRYQLLVSADQEGGPLYNELVEHLVLTKKALPEAKFIYSLNLVDDKVHFMLDSTPRGDADHDGVEDHSNVMDLYEDAPVTAVKALKEGRAMTTPRFYRDKWGLFLSGYSPIQNSEGKCVGVIAIDMTLDSYQRNLVAFNKLLVLSFFIVLALSLLCGFVCYRLLSRALGAEGRYRTISDNVSDAIIVINDRSVIDYVNKGIENLLGYSADELHGKHLSVLMPQDLRERHASGFARYISTGKRNMAWQNLELPAVKKDGTGITLEVSLDEFMQDGHRYITGVLRDISQRKLLEQKTEEAMRTKMDFLSMVTHELRTPLTVIRESIGLIEDETAGPVNMEQKNFLLMAKRNLDRLARLVNNVLDYQKLDANRMELARDMVDIRDLIAEIARHFKLLTSEKDLVVETEFVGDIPKISLDRDRITQVLSNFMDNAVKYTPRGRKIILRAELKNESLLVSVKDEGAGIKKDDMPRLFGAFNQMQNAKEKKVAGTGLGLSISKRIIELHAGTVGAESVEGQGTTFFFSLPIHIKG